MKQKIFAPAAGDLASHMRLWITTGLGLVADLFSKWLAWRMLENAPNQNHDIIEGFFAFKLARNPGIAFGIEIGWWPILIATIAGVLLILYLFLASSRAARFGHIGMGFVLAGALGNMVDRLIPPHMVRDFIDFSFWPTFNLADAFLCVGVGLLAISMLWLQSSSPNPNRRSNLNSDL